MNTKIEYGSLKHEEIIGKMSQCSKCGKHITMESSTAFENGMCSKCMELEYRCEHSNHTGEYHISSSVNEQGYTTSPLSRGFWLNP